MQIVGKKQHKVIFKSFPIYYNEVRILILYPLLRDFCPHLRKINTKSINFKEDVTYDHNKNKIPFNLGDCCDAGIDAGLLCYPRKRR